MLYVGLVTGVAAANVAAHAARLPAFRTYAATIVLIVPGLIGARLLHVASHWQVYRRDLARLWDRGDGGAAMYGGLALALVLSAPLLALLDIPLGAFWDVTTFAILVGMIFARFGCLLNGCCAGRSSATWGVYLPNHLGVWKRRVPAQCLEAGWAAVLLASALAIWPAVPFDGALFLLVAAGYAAGRLALESAREAEGGRAGFTLTHAISCAMVLVSLVTLAARWPR